MKLNQSQISRIMQFSNQQDIYYRDIQAEWVDHIASEIEAELESEEDFEKILHQKVATLPPRKFQRSVLMNIHLGVVREFFVGIFNWKILSISLILAFGLLGVLELLGALETEMSERVIKTTFLILMYGTIFIGFWKNKTRRNAHILATVNTIFFLSSLLVFVFRLDWFEWLGFNQVSFISLLLACLSIFIFRGYSMLFQKINKIQWG
ncbi:hypothetical protein OU792_15250 [Algoriphagus sp. NF]|uniref:hypothetical protein n=1 Tax=Algoriphagus sp. NF TaxID=2992756 RepID=UPI00237BB532|nr:hypothetical protein [Algoriphagus sp. NF]MDE0561354.1 hypothetical protein [Algoriphagus sp. NF]